MAGESYIYQNSDDAITEAIAVKSIAELSAPKHGREIPLAIDYSDAEDILLLALLNRSQELSKIWLQAKMPQASEVAMAQFLT